MSNSSIWPIDRNLSDAITPAMRGPGSNGNGGIHGILQSSSITGASPSDYLVSYLGHLLEKSYPLQRCSQCILQPQPTGPSYNKVNMCIGKVWFVIDRLLIIWKSDFTDKIIIMSCRQHGYPWPSLATFPYRSSPPAGLLGYILCPHIAAVCKFGLVVLLLLGHMWGSIVVCHLRARPCFSSSVRRVWLVWPV